MKYILSILLFQSMAFGLHAQEVKVCNFAELEKEFKRPADSTIVVNFWATWCRPCVEEMKYFVQAGEAYKNYKVSFIYVSLDMSGEKDKVERFVKKNGLKGKFYILKDDPNMYINKIDQNWQGDMPYTFLIKPDKTYMRHPTAFSDFQELDSFLKNNLK
jgi:thiol-disulfide isomerase/thioredoxin